MGLEQSAAVDSRRETATQRAVLRSASTKKVISGRPARRPGVNYIPSTAVNQLEMFQAETWDPVRIDLELLWAESVGDSALRAPPQPSTPVTGGKQRRRMRP